MKPALRGWRKRGKGLTFLCGRNLVKGCGETLLTTPWMSFCVVMWQIHQLEVQLKGENVLELE